MKIVKGITGVLTLIVLSTNTFAGDVYRIVGPDGSIVYTDRKQEKAQSTKVMRPPPDKNGIMVLTPGEKSSEQKKRTDAIAQQVAAKAEKDATFKRAEVEMLEHIEKLKEKSGQYESLALRSGPEGEQGKRMLVDIKRQIESTERALAEVRKYLGK